MVGSIEDGGWFNNCELPRYGEGAPSDPELQGSVSSILIISPHRRPAGPPSNVEQNINLQRMCKIIQMLGATKSVEADIQ